jgi:coenzyme F420-dependent glucose-6-phosphate dehydrogenase
MAAVYPGRVFLGLGTGEAMNEIPVGFEWPSFKERVGRLREAIKIIKLLWNDRFVNFKGQYYRLRKANLYTKPSTVPPLYVAANGTTVTELAGEYADGFLTIPFPESHYANTLFPALKRGADRAGRKVDDIEKAVEVYVSYDEDYEKALASIRCWAGTALPFVFNYPIFDPRQIESYGELVGNEQLAKLWCIGTSPEPHIKRIENLIRLGFTNVHISSSSPNEMKTIQMYSREVLPYLRETYGR